MLTALDKARDAVLALPDYEDRVRLEPLRERTRQGELVCPTCLALLWLHAGQVLVPHFAHRRLSDCPHGRVSEAVLAARRLLYRFFQARIEMGKLPARIQLEPVLPELPKGMCLDLMLRRQDRPGVAVVLLESNLKPEARSRLPAVLNRQQWIFRPVFLSSRLKPAEDHPKSFLLDPTQREFRQASPYDLSQPHPGAGPGTLHFVDPMAARWTTLRRLWLVHEPQEFTADVVRASSLAALLWSEAHADWAHPGEADALKRFRESLAAEKRRRDEGRKLKRQSLHPRGAKTPTSRTGVPPALAIKAVLPPASSGVTPAMPSKCSAPSDHHATAPDPVSAPQPDPLPAWLRQGLACVGCGKRTIDWQNASPAKDKCVCRECFRGGVRLPA